jgi:hypothetical protein
MSPCFLLGLATHTVGRAVCVFLSGARPVRPGYLVRFPASGKNSVKPRLTFSDTLPTPRGNLEVRSQSLFDRRIPRFCPDRRLRLHVSEIIQAITPKLSNHSGLGALASVPSPSPLTLFALSLTSSRRGRSVGVLGPGCTLPPTIPRSLLCRHH